MGHNLWLHFGLDEHQVATYFDVHQGYRVLTHSQMPSKAIQLQVVIQGFDKKSGLGQSLAEAFLGLTLLDAQASEQPRERSGHGSKPLVPFWCTTHLGLF